MKKDEKEARARDSKVQEELFPVVVAEGGN